MSFPKKKYHIIYSDPPWLYHLYRPQYTRKNNSHRPIRTAASFYDTMTTEDICNLPVADICENNCALLLWVTNPLMPEGLRVMESWGFDYKTVAFYWVKQYESGKLKYGMGHYSRPNTEPLLLGIKGRMAVLDHSVAQTVFSPVEKHSKKPDVFRRLITKLFGDLPRIELFARQKSICWDAWGLEV